MTAVAQAGGGPSDLVLSGPLLLAIVIAMAAGLLSFFSPCCLPLVPGYLAYVAGLAGQGSTTAGLAPTPAAVSDRRPASSRTTVTLPQRRSRSVAGAMLFVLGFAAVFTSYGALFGSFGALLLAYQEPLTRVLGAMTIAFGLMFTGLLWRVPLAGRTFRPAYRPRSGLVGAPAVGALFGLGWTPCIGPTLAAVLTLATSAAGAQRGAVLCLAYSLGLGIPFVVAAFSIDRVMRRFSWARQHARGLMVSGGSALIVLGVLQVTGLWFAVISRLQVLIATWQAPL